MGGRWTLDKPPKNPAFWLGCSGEKLCSILGTSRSPSGEAILGFFDWSLLLEIAP